ncbi:MAG TPA: hypothetical protein VGI74_09525 [Streptosporangiaceae bacterium]|jgi:hypothetical protein
MDVYVGVEGFTDEGVASAIVRSCGLSVHAYYGRHGKDDLLKKLPRYNEAAALIPWIVLVDLDDDGPCPGQKCADWLPTPAKLMRFRIVVRKAEAWLLADAERIAEFLAVSRALIPLNPEELQDPKETIISLARRSRKRDIRKGLVPRSNSGASVGPTYASDIREFARSQWRPLVAAQCAPSLQRCLEHVRELAAALNQDPAS